MKTIALNISVFIFLVVLLASCDKKTITPTEGSSKKVEHVSDTSSSLKTGEEDDDDPVPMFSIDGVVEDSINNPLQATLELSDVTSSIVIDSTNTDNNGYFLFENVVAGTYDVMIFVNGHLYETRRTAIGN